MDPDPSRKRQNEQEMDVEIKKEKICDSETETNEKIDKIDENMFPILSSMIAAPPKKLMANMSVKMENPNQNCNYGMVFNAFRQFLVGYVRCGGDPKLASTLASYAASLPIPTVAQKVTVPITVKPEPMDEEMKSTSPTPTPSPPSPPPIPPILPNLKTSLDDEVTSEIQRLREAAFGRYKNVLCVICNEWICSRNRKNHIEAHLNYRPYKCSGCDYARRREIFVVQHIKSHHRDEPAVEMISAVDLNVAMEVDRLADECVERTRKLIESMQEKKDGEFGAGVGFDEKALELMLAEESEKKVVVIESVSEVRAKVANYHRKQRTKVLKKIYDTDVVAKQTQLKIVKEEEPEHPKIGFQVEEGFEIKLEDLVKMMQAGGQ